MDAYIVMQIMLEKRKYRNHGKREIQRMEGSVSSLGCPGMVVDIVRESEGESHSVVSDPLLPHGLQPTRLLCPRGFSRQEYWSGLPCPPPGDLPNPGIEPRSPALQADSLPAESPGKPKNTGVGSLSLLQGIFLTWELNQGLLHCRWILYQLSFLKSKMALGK